MPLPLPTDARRRRLAFAAAGLLGGCAALPAGETAGAAGPGPASAANPAANPAAKPAPGPQLDTDDFAPPAPRELRAAWVASVANIDWPSAPGLPAAQQRAEAVTLLDRALAIGLNALILQVRPAADALYASALEPWSEYLTGAQGRAPDDGYDPLQFWVEQAHQRGLELHAWFNPYRARHPSATTPLAASHVANTRPALVKAYGDDLWMDPAEPDAVAQTLAVVADVLTRYDIDGIHIDDYFYPYPVKAPGGSSSSPDLPFPDEPAWQRYRSGGGQLARDDWRRQQVNSLVQALHRLVHGLRPGLRFGLSPFGLMHPDRRPPGIQGFSQFHQLYADVELWLREGWLDYLAPQLYWPIDRQAQAFAPLLDRWLQLNTAGREVWPGLFTSMVGAPQRPWPAQELLNQVDQVRQRPGAGGHIHFSIKALMQDRDGLASKLMAGPYQQAALIPPRPAWLDAAARPPEPPHLLLTQGVDGQPMLGIRTPAAGAPFPAVAWAVWRRVAGHWQFARQGPGQLALNLTGADTVVVSAVGRSGHESLRRRWRQGQGLRLRLGQEQP